MKEATKKSEGRMMMKKLEESECAHKIDLVSVDRDGSFPCPKCGTSISPDDETEENYQILDTKVQNNELSELVIACGKCGCTITLTGFQHGLEA